MAPQFGVVFRLSTLTAQKRRVVDDIPRSIGLSHIDAMFVSSKDEVFLATAALLDAVRSHRNVRMDEEVESLNGLFDDSKMNICPQPNLTNFAFSDLIWNLKWF